MYYIQYAGQYIVHIPKESDKVYLRTKNLRCLLTPSKTLTDRTYLIDAPEGFWIDIDSPKPIRSERIGDFSGQFRLQEIVIRID